MTWHMHLDQSNLREEGHVELKNQFIDLELFEKKSSNGFGLLLFDAKNTFNSINRSSALLNARTLWSRANIFLYNSYQESSKLVLSNTDVFIRSEEGTTQSDPLSMLFYDVALLPLIKTVVATNS